MMIGMRRLGIAGAFVLSLSLPALATAQAPPTPLDRQLARIDFSISGKGEFTTSDTGNTYLPQSLYLVPSNTLGALITLRYTRSPFVGLEFNYGYARYTENYTVSNVTGSPAGATGFTLGVQTNASEYTFGYVVHTPHPYFGVQPFADVGAGSIDFHPTPGGGQGLLPQARAAYFYNVGAESQLFDSHFGLRVAFRQVFFLAPDYESNYIRNLQRAVSTEPNVGFYVHF